jgi:hypothetical protein
MNTDKQRVFPEELFCKTPYKIISYEVNVGAVPL